MRTDLEQLYADRFDALVELAGWVVGDRVLAEEIVQETFIRFVARPPELRDPDALPAYVRSALMNRCRSRLRRVVLEARHARTQRDEVIEDRYVDDPVRQAVLVLPMRQRQCVVLRFYEDLTIDQIASTLDMKPGTVKSHLHRAMANLSKQLSERVPDDLTS